MKLEFVVFLADFVQFIIRKVRANVVGVRATIGWLLVAPLSLVRERKEGLNFAGNVKKTKHVRGGKTTENLANSTIHSSVIKNLRIIFPLFRREELMSLRSHRK